MVRNLLQYPITYDEMFAWLRRQRVVQMQQHGGSVEMPVGDLDRAIIDEIERHLRLGRTLTSFLGRRGRVELESNDE